MKRSSRPQLFCGTILQVFQQFTGINVIMFYAPVLFQTMGFGGSASLLSAVVTGLVNVISTLVAIFTVDRFGRRALLLESVVQMLIAQVSLKFRPTKSFSLIFHFNPYLDINLSPYDVLFIMQCTMGGILTVFLKSTNQMPEHYAKIVVFLVCFFVAGFAWSWGPLGWLIPSEIFPLETRNAGFFFAVSMNMFCTFLIAQAFLSMLCRMRSGIFFFFSAWIVAMGLFACFLLPETKGIPIDEMNERAWKRHWFWKRYFSEEEDLTLKKEDNDPKLGAADK